MKKIKIWLYIKALNIHNSQISKIYDLLTSDKANDIDRDRLKGYLHDFQTRRNKIVRKLKSYGVMVA